MSLPACERLTLARSHDAMNVEMCASQGVAAERRAGERWGERWHNRWDCKEANEHGGCEKDTLQIFYGAGGLGTLNAVVGRPTDPTDVGHRGADSYPKSDLWEGRAKRPNSRGTPRRGLGRANIRGGARPIVTRDDRAQRLVSRISCYKIQ